MAVSLKALCYAIYVSAAITCLLSLPFDVILGTAGGAGMFRMLRYIRAMRILPYVLVLVLFYKIRDRLDKKKDGPWVVFFAVGLLVTVLGMVFPARLDLISLLAMLGAIWKAREKLKEHEASGQDMPYYDLVGSTGTESSTTGGNVEMIQVAAKP